MERKVFLHWTKAFTASIDANGADFDYWNGKCTALTEVMADLRDCTFVEASRILMNMRYAAAQP